MTTEINIERAPYHLFLGMLARIALEELSTGKTAALPVPSLGDLGPHLGIHHSSAFGVLHSELRKHLPKSPPPIALSNLPTSFVFSVHGSDKISYVDWHEIAKKCGFEDKYDSGANKTAVELGSYLDIHLMALDTAAMILEQESPEVGMPGGDYEDAERLCNAVFTRFWVIR